LRAIAAYEDLFEDTKKYDTGSTESNNGESFAAVESEMDEHDVQVWTQSRENLDGQS
jgi:hypothetical protein